MGEGIMKLANFLVLAAIVAGFFGLALLVVPAQLVDLYGVKLTPATEVIGRIAGATNLGFGILFWSVRNASGAEAVKPAMLAGMVASGLICLIMLHGTAVGLVNALGWGQVAINGLLAFGFGYFYFGKR
jgi:hypothetical protein